MQVVPSSIPMSNTFFHGDLAMKKLLWPFSLFRWFKKSSCHLLAKECALSTGKLPRRLAQEQCGRSKWPKIFMSWRALKQKSNKQNLQEIKQTKSTCFSYRSKSRGKRKKLNMSHHMTKPTKWHVCPVKTQISLGIRPVWSESSLSTWRKLGSLATH